MQSTYPRAQDVNRQLQCRQKRINCLIRRQQILRNPATYLKRSRSIASYLKTRVPHLLWKWKAPEPTKTSTTGTKQTNQYELFTPMPSWRTGEVPVYSAQKRLLHSKYSAAAALALQNLFRNQSPFAQSATPRANHYSKIPKVRPRETVHVPLHRVCELLTQTHTLNPVLITINLSRPPPFFTQKEL